MLLNDICSSCISVVMMRGNSHCAMVVKILEEQYGDLVFLNDETTFNMGQSNQTWE